LHLSVQESFDQSPATPPVCYDIRNNSYAATADTDTRTVQALRSDLALQIARHIRCSGQTQVSAAKRLAVPQPTVSQIMHGKVSQLSLELLIRIAVRAELPVVLQTGKDAEEAGAFVAGEPLQESRILRSKVADEARSDVERRC